MNRQNVTATSWLWMTLAVFAIGAASDAQSQEEHNPFVDDPPRFEEVESEAFDYEGFEVEFPEGKTPLWCELLEAGPTVLSWPDEPLGNFFGHMLGIEHHIIETEIEEHAIGIQPIPSRPPLLIEWNELFLGPGTLAQGIETPTGAIWRPAFWVFGEYRGALQYFDRGDPSAEWTNRLDLFGQLNLSGT